MAGEAGRNWEERRRGISNQDRLYEKKNPVFRKREKKKKKKKMGKK